MQKLKFNELNISKEIQKAIDDMGFEEASPIQSAAIPILLEGKDVIGQAQTGTGKTVAFGIPAIEKINPKSSETQVLILCPTRELCLQVSEEITKLIKYKKGINVLPIYGGQSIERQIQGLKRGSQVVIGTPGRIIDHLERKTLKLNSIKLFVLDEADEMLNMGFVEDIEFILETTPSDKQTVFFSATMPKQILELTKKYQNSPELVKVVHNELTVPNIEQIYFEVKDSNKFEALSRLIDINNIKLGLVFCNTKRRVDELVEQLESRGYSADALHGDMRQAQRENVMKRFRGGNIELLIATDVAARGIDVDDIEIVINYDIPYDEESYVHRIGRTGRAGKDGKAFTFVSSRDMYKLRDIQKYAKTKINAQKVPLLNEVEEIRINDYLSKVKTTIDSEKIDKYVKIIEKFLDNEEYTTTDIAAALLKINLGLNETSRDEFDLIEMPKSPNRGAKRGGKLSGNIARLFLSVGHRDNVSPKNILGAIAGETGLSGDEIGEIDIYDKFSFVEIPKEHTEKVLEIMNGAQIRGKKVNVEVAQEQKSDRAPRFERSGGGDRNERFGSDRSERFGRDRRDREDSRDRRPKKGVSKGRR
jgi:ATP-dependent RNA helicase DeaD